MVIDVLINSCARPDVMDISLKTFIKHVKSEHEFRYIILEDYVKNKKRREKGIEWINKNKDIFNIIEIKNKRLGPGYFFAPIVELCSSDYFFHLEDDSEFIVDVYIDPLISLMETQEDIIEIMLSRGKINKNNKIKEVIIDDIKLLEFGLFSVATGIFNTKLVKKIIDITGWNKKLNEAALLTPISEQLGYKKFVLGHDEKHYEHLGIKKGYKKGGWK